MSFSKKNLFVLEIIRRILQYVIWKIEYKFAYYSRNHGINFFVLCRHLDSPNQDIDTHTDYKKKLKNNSPTGHPRRNQLQKKCIVINAPIANNKPSNCNQLTWKIKPYLFSCATPKLSLLLFPLCLSIIYSYTYSYYLLRYMRNVGERY